MTNIVYHLKNAGIKIWSYNKYKHIKTMAWKTQKKTNMVCIHPAICWSGLLHFVISCFSVKKIKMDIRIGTRISLACLCFRSSRPCNYVCLHLHVHILNFVFVVCYNVCNCLVMSGTSPHNTRSGCCKPQRRQPSSSWTERSLTLAAGSAKLV